MALTKSTTFYQVSGTGGLALRDRRQAAFFQAGSPGEYEAPIGLAVGGVSYSGTPPAIGNGDMTTFTFDANRRLRTDTQLVLSGGDLQIGAVEIKNGDSDTRLSVIADNAAAGTPNVIMVGGEYNASAQTYSDGDAAGLQMDASGNLKVTGGASSVQAEFTSPSDFTATYTSSSTITLTGVPFTITDKSQIVYVKQILTGNTAVTFVAGANGIAFGYSSGVITVYQYGSVITTLASTDVYEVGLNAQKKAYDSTLDVTKVVNQSPDRLAYVFDSLLDTTNIAAGSTYYPSATGMSMDGFRNLSLTGKFIDADGTMTAVVEASNDEDTTNMDVIQVYGYDTKNNALINNWSVTSGTTTFAIDFDGFNYSTFRVTMNNTGSSNTGIIKARRTY